MSGMGRGTGGVVGGRTAILSTSKRLLRLRKSRYKRGDVSRGDKGQKYKMLSRAARTLGRDRDITILKGSERVAESPVIGLVLPQCSAVGELFAGSFASDKGSKHSATNMV